MQEYKDLYYKLFNGITSIIEELKELQAQAEEPNGLDALLI